MEPVKKATPKQTCPHGHRFGIDFDNDEDCDECPSKLYNACEDASKKPVKKVCDLKDNKEQKSEPVKTIDMEENLKQLRAMLTCDKFIITGSQALKKYGLISRTDDIDILLVNPTPETVKQLEKLQEELPAATKAQVDSEKYEDTSLLAIFKWNGVKVDVFQSGGENTLCIDGFEYALILNIVKAKLEANRLKDWLQLRKMAAKIWTREAMAAWLNSQEKNV